MERPSGLHAGRLSLSGSLSGPAKLVSCRGAAPGGGAASITYRSQLLSRSKSGRRLLTKTSRLPSGDHAGRLRSRKQDRKSTRLNYSHTQILYVALCLEENNNSY